MEVGDRFVVDCLFLELRRREPIGTFITSEGEIIYNMIYIYCLLESII